MLRYSLVLVAGLLIAGPLPAATWADAVFDELKKDFGSVPRGPTLTHHFRITNSTKQSLAIASVRVSCGCVTAVAAKGLLSPGESTILTAHMDTTRFIGPRTVTIFVQFSSPAFEEVRLWVQANSRNDFHLTPDTLAFGSVKRGTTPNSSVTLTFHGNREARITRARPESNYVQPVVVETRRLDHEVVYTITTKLRADTPVGKWFTDLWLETNVPGLAQVRVPLTVEVESPLTISPPLLVLGGVKAGSESEKKVIVRGVAPFRIMAVKGTGAEVTVRHDAERREVHVLTIKARPTKEGKLARSLQVVTDLKGDNVIDFRVDGDVLP